MSCCFFFFFYTVQPALIAIICYSNPNHISVPIDSHTVVQLYIFLTVGTTNVV